MQTDTIEEVNLIRDSVQDFANKEILPHRMEWDEKQHFPVDVFRAMGGYGFLGVLIPVDYEGAGLGYQEYVTILDEISKVCGAIGLSVAAHNSLCSGHILTFGTEEQKEKYLPSLATGRSIGAWGLTEATTGSDALRMRTTAKKEGEHYIINGAKTFITHGISGDVAVIMARTGDMGESKGISAFIVEAGTEGYRAGKKEDKLGMRASETAEIILDNCRIHKDQMLGEEGDGFIQAMKVLDGGRISIAAMSLGIAKGAYEAAAAYAGEREQFGKPIERFQGVAFMLADMATRIQAAELLTRQAADLKNRAEEVTKSSAQAKLYASETAVHCGNISVQIHGGYGYIKEYPAEKYYRDAKLCTIGEGTSEIQKIVISRNLIM